MPSTVRPGLLERLGLARREARAWVMYDWANSGMLLLVVTTIFPIFFSQFVSTGVDPRIATGRFTLATTLGLAVIALLSPFLGTLADQTASKLRFLAGFLGLGVLATAAMFFIQQGAWLFALLLFALANIGLNGSFVFYDALLPHVAAPEDQDRVSSAGFAVGYFGSSILLAFGLALIILPGRFGLPAGEGLSPTASSLPTRISFVLAAIWWAVFSIPLFRRVPEPPVAPRPEAAARRGVLVATLAQLAGTFRELRRFRDAFVFLIAFLIYNDGIGTIIRLATVYGSEIGIGRNTLIGAILITQLVGVPFALLFGQLAGRIGPKSAILIGIAVYMGISIVGYFMRTGLHFLLLAILVGTVQGGTQALSRSLFASMIPKRKSGEFFGFYSVFEKGASILGPMVFWLVLEVSGSSRNGILALISFFLVGGGLLLTVDVERGRRAAAG